MFAPKSEVKRAGKTVESRQLNNLNSMEYIQKA